MLQNKQNIDIENYKAAPRQDTKKKYINKVYLCKQQY